MNSSPGLKFKNIFDEEPRKEQFCVFLFDDEFHMGYPIITNLRVIKWHWVDYCHNNEYLNQEYMSDKEPIKWWYPIPNLFTEPEKNLNELITRIKKSL